MKTAREEPKKDEMMDKYLESYMKRAGSQLAKNSTSGVSAHSFNKDINDSQQSSEGESKKRNRSAKRYDLAASALQGSTNPQAGNYLDKI